MGNTTAFGTPLQRHAEQPWEGRTQQQPPLTSPCPHTPNEANTHSQLSKSTCGIALHMGSSMFSLGLGVDFQDPSKSRVQYNTLNRDKQDPDLKSIPYSRPQHGVKLFDLDVV